MIVAFVSLAVSLGAVEGHRPTFPVVDPAPSVAKTMANLRGSDYATWGFCTAASMPFGYAIGEEAKQHCFPFVLIPPPIPLANAATCSSSSPYMSLFRWAWTSPLQR